MRNSSLLLIALLGIGLIAVYNLNQSSILQYKTTQDFGCISIQQYQKLGIYVKNICDKKNVLAFTLQDAKGLQYEYRSDCMAPQQSSYFTPQIDNQTICVTSDCQILETSYYSCSYSY